MKNLLFIITILFSQVLFSQNKTVLTISYTDTPNSEPIRVKTFKDSSAVNFYLQNTKNKLISKGYISASIDSINFGDSTFAYLNKGDKYTWGNVTFAEEFEIIGKTQFQKSTKKNKEVNINEIENKIEKTINYFENNGYPFCSIQFKNIEYDKGIVNCHIEIQKNKQIIIDSIIVKGNAKISPKYIQRYIEIKPTDLYNEKKIVAITKKINNLNFLNTNKESDVLFYEDKVKIILYVDKKPSSRFDGILGVIPRDKTSGRVLLTGELNLFLVNSFARAETIGFSWSKTDNETQKVDMIFDYPYVFNTILGVGANFNLLKQDTSYLNLRFKVLLNFILPKGNKLNFFIENKNSTLLSTQQYENSTVLPPFADTKLTLYGLGINSRNTDRFYSPMKGYIFYIESSIGNKNIKKNNKLPEELYSEIDLNSLQIESKLNFEAFIKIKKRTVLKLTNQTKYIYNEQLFANELFRFGGLKSIRGFKEDELFADFYSVSTVQLSYFYERFSSFYLFSDFGYYESHINEFIHDTPIGVGVGADFSSKAGIFTISYAIGKQFDNAFDLQTARIHFGYLAQF